MGSETRNGEDIRSLCFEFGTDGIDADDMYAHPPLQESSLSLVLHLGRDPFVTHACLGWKKVAPVLVPKRHITKSEHIGFALIVAVGLIYLSPPYMYGSQLDLQDTKHLFKMQTTLLTRQEHELQPTQFGADDADDDDDVDDDDDDGW